MKIDMTPEFQTALIERMTREFAETSLANFALDMLADGLARELKDARAHNEALAVRNRDLMDELAAARADRDSLRKADGPHAAKRR